MSLKKIKFENYKNCFKTAQLDNKIKYLEKNKINVDRLKKIHKKLIRNNKSILKTQLGFTSEKHNVFIEEINKISLCSNYNKRINHLIW